MVEDTFMMTNADYTYHLNVKTKIGYSVGHILGDMAISLQTSYMMIFYQSVLNLEKSNAGLTYLVGEIADAFTGIAVGFLSDLNINFWPFNKYWRRKVSSSCIKLNDDAQSFFGEVLNSIKNSVNN